MLGHALRVYRDDGIRSARGLFFFSILYLFLIFAALLLDRGADGAGLKNPAMIAKRLPQARRRFRRIGALRDARGDAALGSGDDDADGRRAGARRTARHPEGAAAWPADGYPEVGDWLAEAEADPPLDAWQRGQRPRDAAAVGARHALSEAQVEALSRATTACEAAWREAKADADFAAVLPALAHLSGAGSRDRGGQGGKARAVALRRASR